MRPHSPTNSGASGLARARTLMKAKLWWLEGYPTDDGWVVVPTAGPRGAETLSLDRNHLRRATYTANKLRGEFPRAMPKLVGDVDAWHAAVSEVLKALKPWVHGGDAPPSELFSHGLLSRTAVSRAKSLAAAHPSLRPMVNALSWILATRASLLPKYLKWISAEADALTVLHQQRPLDEAVGLGVRCAHLAILAGPKAVSPLTRLLAAPATYSVPIKGGGPYMEQAERSFRVGGGGRSVLALPKPQLVAQLDGWLDWLLSVDRTTAKRFLKLLALCDLPPLISAWEQWWPVATRAVTKASHIQAHVDESRAKHDRLTRLRREHTALTKTMPPHLDVEGLSETLRAASGGAFADSHAAACRVLARVADPSRAALRAGLLIQWVYLRTQDNWWNARWMPTLLRSMAKHFSAISEDDAVTPWAAEALRVAARGRWAPGLLDHLVDGDELELADIPRFFTALAWLREHAPTVNQTSVGTLVITLVAGFHDAELAARLAEPMMRADQHDRWYAVATLRATWSIADPDPEAFPRLLAALEELDEDNELDAPALVTALHSALGDNRELLRHMMLDDDRGALLSCGRKVAALQALGSPTRPEAPTDVESPDWVEQYPAAFHDDLAWLCRLTPRARAIATKALRSVHQGRDAIEAELDTVRVLVSETAGDRQAALHQRCATLEARLEATPSPPSAAKLDKLRTNLRRRGGLALLSMVEQTAEESLRAQVAEHFGLELSTSWLLDERLLRLLVPLQNLSASTRRLATTLLQCRAAEPPWDLREHPANAEFLARLREMSIDPRPWVEGIGEVTVHLEGTAVHLRLEDDPLEVFHMGRHFGTCLSPGQCNFFSVFANASDINKRVLYARNAKGRVLGRRLICVTREGNLLAFHAYVHDDTTGFEKHSSAFVLRLAEAMGTSVVGRGTVLTLVASDWYDDGPVDITGQFDSLKGGSPFRIALAKIRPDRLPALLAETFGGAKIDEGLAPMLLALPEFTDRPQLVASLLPLVRHTDRLPPRAALQAGQMLARADAIDHARALFEKPMANALWLSYREHQWMDYEVVDFLARCAPSRALQLLRRTRHRGVRRWDDEDNCERLLAAATAMQALRRTAQAIRMCRLAIEASSDADSREEAKRRLAALQAQPSRGRTPPA